MGVVVSPLGRMLALRGADMTTVVVVRTLLAACILFLWLLLKNPRSLRISFKDGLVLLAYAVLAIPLTATGFLYSLKYLTVPAALIIHYTFPLATLLGGLWITGERPTAPQYIAALLVIAGVWLGVFSSGTADGSFSLLGGFWGLLAVVGLSGQFLMGRVLLSGKRLSGVLLIFYSHLFGGLIMAALKTVFSGWGDLAAMQPSDWGAIAIGARRQRARAHRVLLFPALRHCSDGEPRLHRGNSLGDRPAALMSGEIPTLQEINGSLLIILAIFLAALPEDFLRRLREERVV